jgi:protein O-mannosyl-transferase
MKATSMPNIKGPSPVKASWPWLNDVPGALLLVLAMVVTCWPALHGGFLWDDDVHLTANPCIIGPLGFKEIWTSSAAVYYPLVLTSFWVQYQLWGLNPLFYHLINVAMHAACAVLLWQVLRRLQVRGAWLGAALWALHPVQVESVAWITELKNTQSCLFYLLAICFFLKWRTGGTSADRRHIGWDYALALLGATLAILSKASTVMLPVVLGLCWWWQEGRWRWRNGLWLIPFFLISAAAGVWTIWEQQYHSGALGPEWVQSWPERLVIAGKTIWFYLGKLLWPHPLMFIYPRWTIDAARPAAYLPALAVAMALVVLWCNRNGRLRPAFFALVYFLVSLFPVCDFFNVYFFRYSFVGDHFQYLASISPLALAAAWITVAADSIGKGRWFLKPAFCGVLLVGLGILTWRQSTIYTNNETLWNDTLAKNPNAWMAHNNLGAALADQGRFSEAIVEYRASVRINPDNVEAYNNLGTALVRLGRGAEAIRQWEQSLQIKPDYAEAHNNLAIALAQAGRMPEAIGHWERALQIKPGLAEAHNDLGTALMQTGKFEDAIGHYEQALRVKPDFGDAHYNWGVALFRLGKVPEATGHWEQTLRLKPDYVEAHYNLGIALAQTGRVNEAIGHYKQALQLKPDYADAHYRLALALKDQGQFDAAIAHCRKVLELEPRPMLAQNTLAWLLATCPDASLRNGPRAVELAQQAAQFSGGASPEILDTLAAAYAEAGRFSEAVETARLALNLAATQNKKPLAEAIQTRLKLYEAHAPYHESP